MSPELKICNDATIMCFGSNIVWSESKHSTWAAVIPSDNSYNIIWDCFHGREFWPKPTNVKHLADPYPEKIDKGYLFCSSSWSANFQHFLQDTLPKMFSYKQEVLDKGKDIPILIPDPLNNNLTREMLDIIEIPRNRAVWLARDGQFMVKEMYYTPFHSWDCSDFPFECLKQIHIKCNRLYTSSVTNPNIYISRNKERIDKENNNNANGVSRVMSNEKEFSETLDRFGFQTLRLGSSTIKEKCELMHNTKTIVVPSGAGVMNLLFTRGLKNLIVLDSGCGKFLVRGWEKLLECIYGEECKYTYIKSPVSSAGHLQKPFTIDIKSVSKAIERAS